MSESNHGNTWTKQGGFLLHMMDDSLISAPVVGPSPITNGNIDGLSGFITTQNMKDAIMNIQPQSQEKQWIQIDPKMKKKSSSNHQ